MKILIRIALTAVLALPLSSFAPQVVSASVEHKSLKQQSTIARKLELTDDQQTTIKELSSQLQKTAKDLRKSITNNRKKIQEMITDDSYSQVQADALLKENAELEQKIDVATLATHKKLTALLTPLQLQKLRDYNSATNPKHPTTTEKTDTDEMKNSFPREKDEDGFAYSYSFNGVTSPMNNNGLGALLPRGERELLFPSSSLFALSILGDGTVEPFQELRELQFLGDEIDVPPTPPMPQIYPPKVPRLPKMPRLPKLQNAPKWDFDIEDSEDTPDSKINQKMEELERKLKELEKRLEQKTPKK
jgi:Spy/CpxP family protein refolding chaperone